jgi:hypothetical protein
MTRKSRHRIRLSLRHRAMPATRRGRRSRTPVLASSITIRVSETLDRRIARLAERDGRSYSDIVRRALARGLEALEANPPPA